MLGVLTVTNSERCVIKISWYVLCCCAVHAVDQRTEAVTGRSGMRVAVNSMAHDPCNQQYIATGGGDAFGKHY